MNTNAEYDGVPCISFRDEKYEDIEAALKKAWNQGYKWWVVDDSFMIFSINPGDREEQGYAESEEELLYYARVTWFEDVDWDEEYADCPEDL